MSGAYVYTPTERASRRLGLLLMIMLGVALTVVLFSVKTRAQEAQAEVARLEAEIERQQVALSVLSAERAVLANPERLRQLSRDQLDLAPITTSTTSTLDGLANPSEVSP
ncbi:MAG: cell division protein FtsL [Litorimonas sp.]